MNLIFKAEPSDPAWIINVYQDGANLKVVTNGYIQLHVHTDPDGHTVLEIAPE
jgi:hypothetical protein